MKLNLTRVVSKSNIVYVRYFVTKILIQTTEFWIKDRFLYSIGISIFDIWKLDSEIRSLKQTLKPNFYNKKFDIQSSNFEFSAIRMTNVILDILKTALKNVRDRNKVESECEFWVWLLSSLKHLQIFFWRQLNKPKQFLLKSLMFSWGNGIRMHLVVSYFYLFLSYTNEPFQDL